MNNKSLGQIDHININIDKPLKLDLNIEFNQLTMMTGANGTGKSFINKLNFCAVSISNVYILTKNLDLTKKQAQFFFDNCFDNQDINGEINLKGQESVGIYANYGIINNNNIIDTQGKKSFGIFGVNGTDIVTAAGSIIKAGDEGAGIVAQSYVLDPVTGTIVNSTYGDGTFKIDHSGEVIMSAGSNSFGIYADNNDTNVSIHTTFEWSGTADVIWLDVNPSFSNPVAYTVTGNSYTVTDPLSTFGNYYWKAGRTVGGKVYWSENYYYFQTGGS